MIIPLPRETNSNFSSSPYGVSKNTRLISGVSNYIPPTLKVFPAFTYHCFAKIASIGTNMTIILAEKSAIKLIEL